MHESLPLTLGKMFYDEFYFPSQHKARETREMITETSAYLHSLHPCINAIYLKLQTAEAFRKLKKE